MICHCMQTIIIHSPVLNSPFIHPTTDDFFKDHFAHVAPGLPPLSPSPQPPPFFARISISLLGIERPSSQFLTQSSLIITLIALVSADTFAFSISSLLFLTFFFPSCRLISFSLGRIVIQLVEIIANIYFLLHVYRFTQFKNLIRNFLCAMQPQGGQGRHGLAIACQEPPPFCSHCMLL